MVLAQKRVSTVSTNDVFAYVGRAACGCIRASRLDEADKATGRFVQEMIQSGLKVERVPLEQVQFMKCEVCEPNQPEQTSML